MKIWIILLITMLQYALLAGIIFSIISTLLKNSNFRVGVILGVLAYFTIVQGINNFPAEVWNDYGRSFVSTIAIIVSMVIASSFLGYKEPHASLKSTIFFMWAIYSINIYVYFRYVPEIIFFDYPNGPNLMNEFWSYFTWTYLEVNRPVTTIIIGSVVLETIKFIRRKKDIRYSKIIQ